MTKTHEAYGPRSPSFPGSHPLLAAVEAHRAFAVLRTPTPEVALAAGRACLEGGLALIEITLTVPDALGVVRALAADPRAIVGVGTVMTCDQVRAAASAGARFAVSPHFDPDLLAESRTARLLCIQGGVTPTEVMACHRAGVDLTKVFPAPSFGGAAHIAALRQPMPFLRLVPSGGVPLEDMLAYLDAGAVAVGLTGALADPPTVARGDFALVRDRARQAASMVAGWHAGRAAGARA